MRITFSNDNRRRIFWAGAILLAVWFGVLVWFAWRQSLVRRETYQLFLLGGVAPITLIMVALFRWAADEVRLASWLVGVAGVAAVLLIPAAWLSVKKDPLIFACISCPGVTFLEMAAFLGIDRIASRNKPARETIGRVRWIRAGIGALVVMALVSVAFFGVATWLEAKRCNSLRPGAHLAECDYEGKDFAGRDLHDADLSKAILHNANLSGANLQDADLSEADLSGANVQNAQLQNAILNGADMHDAQGVTDAILATLGDWHGLVLVSRSEIAVALARVCSGEPYPGAMAYDAASADFYPLVLLDSDGTTHDYTDNMPKAWWPARPERTALVACAEGERKVRVDTCHYESNRTITVDAYEVTVRLVSAQTGKLINSIIVHGHTPSCPATTTSNNHLTGTNVLARNFANALEYYVHPGGPIMPLTTGEAP